MSRSTSSLMYVSSDCFDPATVTLESVHELKALLKIDRAFRMIDRATKAATDVVRR